jgi:hypothetical protein
MKRVPDETVAVQEQPNYQRKLGFPGCLGGCLILIGAALLIYVVSAGFALSAVEGNYRKWASNGFTGYSVTIRFEPFESTSFDSRQEIVKGGKVANANTAYGLEPTINRMFETARSCAVVPIPFMRCDVEYDPLYGYPSKVHQEIIDGGSVTEIIALTPEPSY